MGKCNQTKLPERRASFTEVRAKMIVAIGEESAGKLMNTFAGQMLYLSPSGGGKDAEKIIKVIGLDAAVRLFSTCGNNYVYFPKWSHIITREWHKAVVDAYEGQDLCEYARDCGSSTVTLRKILKRHGKKPTCTKRERNRQEVKALLSELTAAYQGGPVRAFAKEMGVSYTYAKMAVALARGEEQKGDVERGS
jgi:Mor family transcriptional regulator